MELDRFARLLLSGIDLYAGEGEIQNIISWEENFTNGIHLTKEDCKCYDLDFARQVKVLYSNISHDKFALGISRFR